jgi:hypothetical protein
VFPFFEIFGHEHKFETCFNFFSKVLLMTFYLFLLLTN